MTSQWWACAYEPRSWDRRGRGGQRENLATYAQSCFDFDSELPPAPSMSHLQPDESPVPLVTHGGLAEEAQCRMGDKQSQNFI